MIYFDLLPGKSSWLQAQRKLKDHDAMTTKKVTPVDKRILIVSDSADELTDLQHLFDMDFGRCLKADSESEGLRLFNENHPMVLILAFQKIEKAEHFYLSLYRHYSQIHAVPHQTLLLCKSSESSQAYQLCRSGTFDDYISDRPLYDPFRLRLSVVQALTRRSQEWYSYLLNDQIENIADGLQQFDQFVSSKLKSGNGQQQETIRTFQHFTQNLASALKQLEKNLIGDSLPEMDKKNLSHQFDRLREDSLQRESLNVVEQLNKTSNWMEELNNGYKDKIGKVQQNSESIQTHQIMLVDDDEFYRDMLTTMLQEADMHVLAIGDGRTALAKLQHSKPKLILLDYKMPSIDGIATLKQIRSNPDTKSIPVIMLTGVSEREIVVQCIEAGATDFIVKPSERSTILSKIDDIFKRQSATM